MGLLKVGVGTSLTLLHAIVTLLLLLGCLIQLWYVGLSLFLLHLFMPCSVDITGRFVLFLKETKQG